MRGWSSAVLNAVSLSHFPGVDGSAELATQTALDLLLNMSTQRELAAGSLQVSRGWLCLLQGEASGPSGGA